MYFPGVPKEEDIKIFGKLYQQFIVPNAETALYFEEEYNRLLRGKRVLGVLSRGTDYTATRPKDHPIQPQTEDLIELAREKLKELNCEAIYLATEEEAVHKKFEAAFPGRVLINKRRYFDDYYRLQEQRPGTLISAVSFERDNDSYYKSLEYLSSIMLLSKCCGLVAGTCGGSVAALYLNNCQYEYWHLFDLGRY